MSGQQAIEDPPSSGARGISRRVFISYARDDRGSAETLARLLADQGLSVWTDATDIALGDSILASIDDALRRSDAIVVILSDASQRSAWVSSEVAAAVAARIAKPATIIIPLLMGPKAQIPPLLQDTQGLRIQDESGLQGAATTIAERLSAEAASPRNISNVLAVANLQAANLELERKQYLTQLAKMQNDSASRTVDAVLSMLLLVALAALTLLFFVGKDHGAIYIALNSAFLVLNGAGLFVSRLRFKDHESKDRT